MSTALDEMASLRTSASAAEVRGKLINIDNGGTLTDICVIDGDKVWRTKTLTTPYDLRSEEHTSELQSLMRISYAVFCLKKKKCKYGQTLRSYTGYTPDTTQPQCRDKQLPHLKYH